MTDILDAIDATLDAATGRCARCGRRLPADGPEMPSFRLGVPVEWRDEDVARLKAAFLAAAHHPGQHLVLVDRLQLRPPWWRRLLRRIDPRRGQ